MFPYLKCENSLECGIGMDCPECMYVIRTTIVHRCVDGIIIVINICSVRRTNVRHIDGRTRHYDNEETQPEIYINCII